MLKQYPFRIDDKPSEGFHDVLRLCQDVIDASVKTGNPLYQNQLFQGMDPYGLAASFLIEALNTNVHTYEICPAFTVLEREVIHRLNQYIGFPDGDGIFCAGGSLSNMYGVNLARYQLDSKLKTKGLYGSQPLAIFVSDQGHYSFQKGAAFMGIGVENVISVPSDPTGAMIPEQLDAAIAKAQTEGKRSLIVVATLGTTVLGAVDPVGPIADICQRRDIWLHADACLGGAFLLSPKLRSQLAGIERCDSVTWNWHKLASAPLLCSAFLTRHRGLLAKAHGFGAEYLFKRKYYDPSNDSGDHSIQCGRKGDAVKVWLMLKARGASGMAAGIEAAADSACSFADLLRSNPRFKLVLPQAQMTSVCFWVIPPSVAKLTEGTPEYKAALEKVGLVVKERMVRGGEAMVALQPIGSKGLPSFFRTTVAAFPGFPKSDRERLIEILTRLSDDL